MLNTVMLPVFNRLTSISIHKIRRYGQTRNLLLMLKIDRCHRMHRYRHQSILPIHRWLVVDLFIDL
ncbi:unnamed protein product [Enterobius vermicularis]|uniref:Secreted protein n=1 Tax=Enterobius vermicularis TaxID=51028 RepID=A0A0N4VRP6_ENTVE|nr:unnamed protein product [Enterobius vermicularis]